ncbi:alpha/beta hydrolase [Saccharopolyspora sp. SCSIO 74807]|uniref:alpha/beta hydrolase n=1 Tax=Saccharopolyspora sp. SCSIO 74807 TaxID=3118084 RepID=UPI0030CBFA25
MSTYVLVHGAAHGGWCYRRVARILRAAGHDVHAPTLTGLGERAHLLGPDVDLDLHVQDVLAVLRTEDLFDVVLAGHSYGGMVVTGVADRAPERIRHLVYLDAATPVHGEAIIDLAPVAIREHTQVVDGVELVHFPDTGSSPIFGVTDPEDAAWVRSKLTPHPYRCFEQPLLLTNEAALNAIPQTQIVCSSALHGRDPARLATARAAGRLWEIDTGHDLMITEPELVADMLMRAPAEISPPS